MRPIGSPDKQMVRSQHHVQVGLVAGPGSDAYQAIERHKDEAMMW